MIEYIEYIKKFIIENQELVLGLVICLFFCYLVFDKKIEQYSDADAALKELEEKAQQEQKESWDRDIFCTQGCIKDERTKKIFLKLAEKNHQKYCKAKCFDKANLKHLAEVCNKEKCTKGRIAGVARDNCIKNGEFGDECLGKLFGDCGGVSA